MTHAYSNYLVLESGERVGPFSSHWAACAAMIRLHTPDFKSIGGDKEIDIAVEKTIKRT